MEEDIYTCHESEHPEFPLGRILPGFGFRAFSGTQVDESVSSIPFIANISVFNNASRRLRGRQSKQNSKGAGKDDKKA